jgi:hypothetical protein
MGDSVVPAICLDRNIDLVLSNGVMFITTFSQKKVVGYFSNELVSLPISPEAKEVMVRVGNLRFKGIIRGDLSFPSFWGKI